MKSLKMNFLCSIFVLRILLTCNTVWAADNDLSDEKIDELMDMFTHVNSDSRQDQEMIGVDENSNNEDDDDDPQTLDGLDQELDDLLVPIAIKAEEIFRWSERGQCQEEKLDRSLDESTTLSTTAINMLKTVHSYIPRETTPFGPEMDNVLAATAQLLGTRWYTKSGMGSYPLGDRRIYKMALGLIFFFLLIS